MDPKSLEKQNEEIRKRMLDVRDVSAVECPHDSPWVRPVRIVYQQDGEQKDWDLVRGHDSVSIIIYNTSRKKLVLVRQFRASIYYTHVPESFGPIDTEKYPPSLGLALELCAGIVDKDKSLVEIARDEVREECGYEAPAEAFKQVVTFRYVSHSVSKHTVFYVEVTDQMRTHLGGGIASEGELIEVVELTIPEIKEYVNKEDVPSPPSLLYGISWFLTNKSEHC